VVLPFIGNVEFHTEFFNIFNTVNFGFTYFIPTDRGPYPAPPGKRALPGEGSFRIPRSAGRPQPLAAIMLSAAGKPSGGRPSSRPVEVCPGTCVIAPGKRRARGRQRIAGLSAA